MAEGGVVQRELGDRVAEVLEIGVVHGEEAAEHHGLRGLETGEGFFAGLLFVGDGVADAGVADLFDARRQEAELPRAEFIDGQHAGAEDADAVDGVHRLGGHHADAVALFQDPVDDADEDDDAEIGVIP